MILVDTSIWIDHLCKGDATLADLLEQRRVLAHPFVTGELSLGSLRQREIVLNSLQELPQAEIAHDEEVLHFIADEALFGLGIGYVDAHLLASVRLTPGTSIWTRDKRLLAAATRLSLAAGLNH
jgi:predicted nucleic acid-binding protein